MRFLRQRAFRIMLPLVGLVLLLAVMFSVFPHFPKWGSQADCVKNLKKLAHALHEHWDKHGTLPPAYVKGPDGKPAHSWRIAILPFLGRQDLYDAYRFDEPWNGPNNSKLAEQMPDVFRCPAADGKTKNCTSYIAVVGSQTAWPGDRGVKLSDLIDGTSTTILLLEVGNSDFPWLEPRDLTMQDLIPWDSDKVGDKFGSPHNDTVTVALCDGSVRTVNRSIQRSALYSALTARGGEPYRGEWLPGEERMPVSQFPSEKPASAFPATTVVPNKFAHIANDRNAIYCATFQVAWDELGRLVDGAPSLEGDPPFAAGLNRSSFPRNALSNDAYVATIGLERDGIRKRITDEMSRKFPNVSVTFARNYQDEGFIAYAFLQKSLPFKEKFEVLNEPMEFRTATGTNRVKCFGIPPSDNHLRDGDVVRQQVKILHYSSDEDFVIQLLPLNDEMVLAKLPPATTLAETLDQVRKRVRDSAATLKRSKVEYKETLAVPHLAFNVLRQYDELIGRKFQNAGWRNTWIAEALQSVRFLLNESGARLESETQLFGDWNGHSEPPKPRRFVFDRPFLLYLKEKDAAEPYLVLWIANTELMQIAR